jgi:hypothetical protein
MSTDNTHVEWNMQRDLTESQIRHLGELIQGMNRKARKAGKFEHGFRISRIGEKFKAVRGWTQAAGDLPQQVTVEVAPVTLQGWLPRNPGEWQVVAIANHEHSTDVTTWNCVAKGVVVQDLEPNTHCDHCNTKRRRNRVFYIKNNEGKIMRVGSTCVKDFLRDVTVADLLWQAYAREFRQSSLNMDEWLDLLPAGATIHDPIKVLALSYYFSKDQGYVSVNRAEDEGLVSTAYEVREALSDPNLIRDPVYLGGWATTRAEATLTWLRSLDTVQDSTFFLNLVAVAKADVVADRHVGILASAVAVYARHLDDLRRSEQVVSDEWVGTIGKRQVFSVTIESERITEGYYGSTIIYNFRTKNGESLVWFCSGAGLRKPVAGRPDYHTDPYVAGDALTIKGTVKDHGEFRGMKQTKLNRVALV